MPPVGFEPTISAGERPHTYALDRAATGTGRRPLLLLCDIRAVTAVQMVYLPACLMAVECVFAHDILTGKPVFEYAGRPQKGIE